MKRQLAKCFIMGLPPKPKKTRQKTLCFLFCLALALVLVIAYISSAFACSRVIPEECFLCFVVLLMLLVPLIIVW